MKFDSLVEDLKEIRGNYISRSKEIFLKALKTFFQEYPDASIRWSQYTPYYNDGEPCTFSVDSPVLVMGEDQYEYDIWNKGEFLLNFPLLAETLWEDWLDIKKVIQEVDEDIFENLFGDHVEVCVNKKGFTVSFRPLFSL